MKANGSPVHRSETITRIAAKEALSKSELRYRRLFETAQDGILILDGNTGSITDANPYLLDLLGYPLEEMFGRHLWEIGEFKDVAASKAAFAVLQNTEYVRYENLPLQSRSGDRRQVEFISNVYDVAGEKVIQCNIREISTRVEIERAAKSRLVGLEFAINAKNSVLAVVSHELRTPLAAISSMLDLIDLGHDLAPVGASADAAAFDKSPIAHIRRNIGSLISLTDQLFDITHITRGTIHLEPAVIDAHEAISEVLKDVETQYKLKKISIDLQLHAWNHHLHADSRKLRQILSNLIDNAIKFTPTGGTIDIGSYNTSAGQIIILVHDNGIGLEGENITRIFAPFEQEDASTHSQYGGLGLGLSIAKLLVEAHEGTLTAESRGKNRGATFILEFKCAPAAPVVKASSPVTVVARRILIVEDHKDTRECLRCLLQSRDHFVVAAATVQEALDLTNDQEFDLLITDLVLPDGNGWNLLQTLRARQPTLEAIAISGYGMPQDISRSKEAGFKEYLPKPFNIRTLDDAVARVFSRAQGAIQ